MNKLTIEPKYWAVIILAAITTGAGAVYYAKQPSLDLGPIVVHHKTASSTVEDLKGWKTYTNSQYGFEFRYPDSFYIRTRDNVVFVESKAVKTTTGTDVPNFPIAFGIKVLPYDKSVPIKNVSNVAKENLGQDVSQKEQTINGTKFTVVWYSGMSWSNNVDYILIKNNQAYVISVTYGYLPSDQAEQIKNQILSTFKFLPQTEIECIGSGDRKICRDR